MFPENPLVVVQEQRVHGQTCDVRWESLLDYLENNWMRIDQNDISSNSILI